MVSKIKKVWEAFFVSSLHTAKIFTFIFVRCHARCHRAFRNLQDWRWYLEPFRLSCPSVCRVRGCACVVQVDAWWMMDDTHLSRDLQRRIHPFDCIRSASASASSAFTQKYNNHETLPSFLSSRCCGFFLCGSLCSIHRRLFQIIIIQAARQVQLHGRNLGTLPRRNSSFDQFLRCHNWRSNQGGLNNLDSYYCEYSCGSRKEHKHAQFFGVLGNWSLASLQIFFLLLAPCLLLKNGFLSLFFSLRVILNKPRPCWKIGPL